MAFVFFRLFFRLFVLFFLLFSIFYFYVFGHIYNSSSDSIISSAGQCHFDFLNRQKFIYINGQKFYLVDNKLDLYNLPANSCISLKIDTKKYFYCLGQNSFGKVVFMKPQNYLVKKDTLFFPLKLQKSSDPMEKYYFFWGKIKFSVFKNGEVVYYDSFDARTLLDNFSGDFVGYDINGLFYTKKDKLYYLKLQSL